MTITPHSSQTEAEDADTWDFEAATVDDVSFVLTRATYFIGDKLPAPKLVPKAKPMGAVSKLAKPKMSVGAAAAKKGSISILIAATTPESDVLNVAIGGEAAMAAVLGSDFIGKNSKKLKDKAKVSKDVTHLLR